MDVIEFLDAVLPTAGRRCAGQLHNKIFANYFSDTNEDLAEAVRRIDAKQTDAYFALGGYGPPDSRKKENVVALRSLWLDIDTQEGKPDAYYTSRKEALEHLTAFTHTVGLPLPIVVSSGYGIHVYWPFDADVTPEVWQPVAIQLKLAAKKFGLDIDNSRTTDHASVLRPPGTSNRKRDPAKLVKIVQDGSAVPLQVLVQRLTDYVGEDDLGPAPRRAVTLNSDLTGGMEYPPSSGRIVADHCGVVGLVRDTGGNTSQPTWYSVIGVLTATTEGEDLAHEWSNGYEGYSHEETSAKYAQASAHGPTTCAKLEESEPAICAACPHFGKIKSPIMLGTARGEPQYIENPPEVVIQASRKPAPDYPTGFGYGYEPGKSEKFMWQLIQVQDPETGNFIQEYVTFGTCHFYAYTRARKPDGTSAMVLYYTDKSGVVKDDLHLDFRVVGEGGIGLRSELASTEILVTGKAEEKALEAYLKAWALKLRDEYQTTLSVDQMGWNGDAFVVGPKLITPTGTQKALISHTVRETCKAFTSKGSIEGWVKGVELAYNRPQDREPQPWQFAVICAFAAPLLNFHDEAASMTVHGYSSGTGYGKTTAAQAGQSAFADSEPLLLRKFTENALFNQLGILRNIVTVVDELTHVDPKFCQTLAFDTSAGKGKFRMTKDGGQAPTKDWKTLVLTTANQRLSEKLAGVRANATAEMVRVFEYGYTYKSTLSANEAIDVVGLIKNNYGLVGIEYMEYVVQHREKVEAMLLDTRRKLNVRYNFDSGERYWSMLFSAVYTALALTRQMKFVSFDEIAFMKWMGVQLEINRSGIVSKVASPVEQFSQMLNELWAGVLVTRGGGTSSASATMVGHVHGKLCGRHILPEKGHTEAVYIAERPITQWCVQNGASMADIEADLQTHGVLKGKLMVDLGKYTDEYGGGAPVKAWQIDANALRAISPQSLNTTTVSVLPNKLAASGS